MPALAEALADAPLLDPAVEDALARSRLRPRPVRPLPPLGVIEEELIHPGVLEALQIEHERDIDLEREIPIYDPDTHELLGAVDRVAYPTDIDIEHQDPDAMVGMVEEAHLTPAGAIEGTIRINPFNMLTGTNYVATNAWSSWNIVLTNQYTTAATDPYGTTGTRMYGNAWANWTNNTGTAATNVVFHFDEAAWGQWIQTAQTGRVAQPLPGTGYYGAVETPEQVAARQERAATAAAERVAEEARRVEAGKKARILLEQVLDDEQTAELITHARFHVKTKKGNEYRLRKGYSHNVDLIRDGHIVGTYCIHPREWVPDEDNMVAQKLMLETMEDDFIKIANYSKKLLPVPIAEAV